MTVLGQGLYREASELHATALQNQGRLNGNGGENSWHSRRDLQEIPVEQCYTVFAIADHGMSYMYCMRLDLVLPAGANAYDYRTEDLLQTSGGQRP